MKKCLLLFGILIHFTLQAQSPFQPYYKDKTTYREHALDISHMRVELSFEADKKLVIGKVIHSFVVKQQRVDSVFFDGPGINIQKATLNNLSLAFNIVPTGVWVIPAKPFTWDQRGEISFEYTANPRKGIYFIGWDQPENQIKDPFRVRRQIWTQGQGIDNRCWIPMYDDQNDKFTTETITTFDANYQVLSNGKLLSKKKAANGKLTWHYAMSKPHAGYLLMLAIGKYAVKTAKSTSGVPLQYWYYPEFEERAEPTYRFTPQMVDFLEQETGVAYPWESYSQVMVQDFLYGAMENTTATIFGDFFNVDERGFLDRNYVGVNCHELTHQWFGDYITARDGRDTWLQESFATFYPKQFSKINEGIEEWDWQRRAHQNAAVEAGKKDNYPVRHSAGGTARVYPKGAAVISMLNYVLGDAQWKRVLTHYLKGHAYGNVETNDMQQSIKDVLGLNLDWFFDEWIYRGGEPHFRVHYEDLSYNNGSKATEIAIEQIHAMSETVQAFKMPIAVEVHYTDGTKDSIMEMVDEVFEVVKIPNRGKKEIAFVLFDPNSNVMKQLTFEKKFEELQEQVEKAQHLLDRYDALVGLRKIEIDKKREVLHEVLKRESHQSMLNEVISQLVNDNNATSVSLLRSMMQQSKSAVRAHLLQQLPPQKSYLDLFELGLKDQSFDVIKTAIDKLAIANPEKLTDYLTQIASISGMNHAIDFKRIELALLNGLDKQNMEKELIAYASPAFEFRTRNSAFLIIKSTGTYNQTLLPHIFNAMLSTNSRLASPAAELANFLCLNGVYKKDFKRFFEQTNFNTNEKEILTNILPLLKQI